LIVRRLVALLAPLSLAACNSFIGVEDVTLARDGGADDIDAAPGEIDAGPDARPADAAAAIRLGNDIELDGSSDVVTGFDLARRIDVPDDTMLLGFGVVTKAAGGGAGQLRMGLYTELDADGPPDDFVARSAVISDFSAGENVLEIAATPLAAGSYWVAIAFNADTAIGADADAQVESCFAMRPFAQAMPTSGFDTATCNTASALNLFIVVSN
jgi:hypothetical protein